MAGILYVIFNKWISNPETKVLPYKIGITSGTVEDRYYGLGLKMPGEFETLFAYILDDYQQAEKFFHNLFKQYHNNGEWFDLNQEQLKLIKQNCEAMRGIDVKDKINIKEDPVKPVKPTIIGKGKITPEEQAAIEELRKVAEFLKGKGFKMRTRDTPFSNTVWISCNVIGNTVRGVTFVISKKLKEPPQDRYGLEYETSYKALYGLKEKQIEISNHFGISKFREGSRNKEKEYIRFDLTGEDLVNEALEIIGKTSRIIGFKLPKEMKSWYNDWYNKNNNDSLKDVLWPQIQE